MSPSHWPAIGLRFKNETTQRSGVLKSHFAGSGVIAILALAACGAVPPVVDSERAAAPAAATGAAVTSVDNSGLGIIIYNEHTRAECVRRTRAGSRIQRLDCGAAESFNTVAVVMQEQITRVPVDQRRVAK